MAFSATYDESAKIQEEEPSEPQVSIPNSIAQFSETEEAIREEYQTNAPSSSEAGQVFNLAEYLQTTFKSDEFGGDKKKLGAVFKNLTVVGEGADANSIPTLWTPVENFVNRLNPFNWFKEAKRGTDFDILHDLTGFCKDGEMLLVLGRPGAGCSTFLRVLANHRGSYKSVTGEVTYGGIPADDFRHYVGENVYTAEEDTHYPTLTVRQTLVAALGCKAPHSRIREGSREQFTEKVLGMLLKMFGLIKQADTIVGNEFIRGLSGGERKRLTIAEAMTARASINCWDCTTRGLDSASALDYIRSLRIMSNTLHRTNIVSLYQASEDMFNLFNKVIVLDKGMCVYFGPTKTAKSYFEDMGFRCEARKSTPDFLTGITNPNERKVKEGFEGVVPQTALDMQERYRASSVHRDMTAELTEYEAQIAKENPAQEFKDHILQGKSRGTRSTSVYITNFWQQIRVLFKREYQLVTGDKGALIGKVISVLLYSIVYGTVYHNLPLNSSGAFTRGSALFNTILFNSFISLSQLPNALRGRTILQKHKTYAMYHPAAYHLAQVALDIPVILMQVFLYSIIAYFLFGFQRTGAHFFTFGFALFLVAAAMMEFFRICANIATNYIMASQLASLSLVVLLIYNGFVIPSRYMHKWFKWIYWANPMAYAYKGMYLTEMRDLDFPCNGHEVVPSGPIYNNPDYQGCAMDGFKPGNGLEVHGNDYLSVHYGYSGNQRVISILAIFFLWVVYIILNCVIMEYLNLGSAGYTRQVYKKGKAPKQNDTSKVVMMEEADLGLNSSAQVGKSNDISAAQTTFTWSDMTYTVPIKGGSKVLLDKVEGWIKPGQMTALMGASGAGKTTLLDVLAQRKTIGKVEGTILLNGEPLYADYERLTGYVEQMDVHNPSQTVREALRFSARMRQDPSVPLEEKYEYVEKVLQMMEMTSLGDALIGDLETGWGISVEERKRLTIGMELVGRPKILFLDEPTSGLDAQSSYNIVKFIRKLADQGMPLVCTIHQPSSVLFEYFDRILLLTHGGKTVYFGDIGKRSRIMLDYFEKNTEQCREDENPAEYILKVVNGKDRVHTVDWPEVWKNSPEKQIIAEELKNVKPSGTAGAQHREFATKRTTQFWEVYSRMNLVWWRTPVYNWGRVVNAILISLFGSFTYYQLGNSVHDLQSRVFAILGIVLMGNNLILLAQPMFIRQRQYFRREYASKFYSWWAFAISIILTELPYLLIIAAVYVLPNYYIVGLQSTAINGFYYYLGYASFMFFVVTFGQAIAAFSATLLQASIMTPLFAPFLILFAGAIIPPQDMPTFWRGFMYNVDPYRYFLEGVVTDVLKNVKVACASHEFVKFAVDPSFGDCGNYTQPYLQVAPGYINNPQATDTCEYCPFSVGPDFYHEFSWHYENRWRNYGIMWAYFASNITLITLFVYLNRKPKR